MALREVIVIILALFIIALMIFYFLPLGTINFIARSGNSNFSVVQGKGMQFYSNMRFPENTISYHISNCPLKEQNDMTYAFSIIENMTPLNFYPVSNDEQISITCENKNILSGDLFIAGEGGPTNVTVTPSFNIITHGEILLIKESNCQRPNVEIHELFHVLGFEHSSNPENIMYNITNCDQTIGFDMIQLINSLYAIPSQPDLILENVSAVMKGRFIDVNMTVANIGLSDAGSATVKIYADGNMIKEVDLAGLAMGYGRIITITHVFVTQLNVNQLNFVIEDNFNEIRKDNNNLILNVIPS